MENMNNKLRDKDTREIVEDFFNTPKLKKRMTTRELKKIYEEQYDEEIP